MSFKPEAPNSELNYRSQIIASRIVRDLLDIVEYEEIKESKAAEELKNESKNEQENKEIEKCKEWRERKNILVGVNGKKSEMGLDKKSTFTLALMGEWGSGKTSILRTILKNKCLLREYEVIHFNPWNVVEVQTLLSQFFIQMSGVLNKKNGFKNLGELLLLYSNAICSFLPSPVAKAVSIFKYEMDSEKRDLQKIKSKIEDSLNKSPRRVLIVIDDIDRLTSKQIQIVFQLVSAIADFPNVTYLLSFDRRIVVNALNDLQGGSGTRYLEKLINIPVILPLPPRNELSRELRKGILEFMQQHIVKKNNEEDNSLLDLREFEASDFQEEIDSRAGYSLHTYKFNYTVKPFLRTHRDVNRVLNAFKERVRFFKNEVDYLDLLSVTVLDLFEPLVWEWVRNHKNDLCISWNRLGNPDNILYELNERKKNFIKKFVQGSELPVELFDHEIVWKAIEVLFFESSYSCDDTENDYSTHSKRNRIYVDSKFDRYFGYSLSEEEEEREKLDSLLDSYLAGDTNSDLHIKEKFTTIFLDLFKNPLKWQAVYDYINDYLKHTDESKLTKFMSLLLDFLKLNSEEVEKTDFFNDAFFDLSEQMYEDENLRNEMKEFIAHLNPDNFFLSKILLGHFDDDGESVEENEDEPYTLEIVEWIKDRYDALGGESTNFGSSSYMKRITKIIEYWFNTDESLDL